MGIMIIIVVLVHAHTCKSECSSVKVVLWSINEVSSFEVHDEGSALFVSTDNLLYGV